jgi:hypothetical protein
VPSSPAPPSSVAPETPQLRRARELKKALRAIRLSLGGAILGVAVTGILSYFLGIDRLAPNVIGAIAGFLIALLFQYLVTTDAAV